MISTTLQLNFYAKIDDHCVRQGDTGRVLARWRPHVASRVSLDLLYWAMRLALYHLICMAVKTARKAGPFLSVVDFMSCITIAKRPRYGLLKIKPSYNIVLYYVLM